MTTAPIGEHRDVLYRMKRGLAGYVSYLAACDMNESFSEYLLYEPILRIFTCRGYSVRFEVECPGVPQPKTGDRKRLDLVATKGPIELALEVKWARSRTPVMKNDLDKLKGFRLVNGEALAFLCVFGRKSHIEKLEPHDCRECGKPVIAEFGKTKYGCRVFELDQ